MESEIIKQAASQGFFALLFICLLFYVLKTTSNREIKYQTIIEKLSEKFEIIEENVISINSKIDRLL